VLDMQGALWCVPSVVEVERRHAQTQPTHGSQLGQNGREIASIAAAHYGDRVTVDRRVRNERIVCSEQVLQIGLPGHVLLFVLRSSMSRQIERQANAAQCHRLPGALQILLLAAPPAMHEKNTGDGSLRREDGTVEVSALQLYLNAVTFCCHLSALPCNIWRSTV
jgi:hypothetical protein